MSKLEEISDPKERLEVGRELMLAAEKEPLKVVYGLELSDFVRMVYVALLNGGHILVNAPIGLAKTTACSACARSINGRFERYTMTSSTQPFDLHYAVTKDENTGQIKILPGPLLRKPNVLLINEANRAPEKSQSVFLDPMEEGHVTLGDKIVAMEPVFIVLLTKNPQEFEGTWELIEAGLDRLLFRKDLDYPDEDTEVEIVMDPDIWRKTEDRIRERVKPVVELRDVEILREDIHTQIVVPEPVARYAVRLIHATRGHGAVKELWGGSSPRGSISLTTTAQVCAFYNGSLSVYPENVRQYFLEILQHRIWLQDSVRGKVKVREVLEEILHEVSCP